MVTVYLQASVPAPFGLETGPPRRRRRLPVGTRWDDANRGTDTGRPSQVFFREGYEYSLHWAASMSRSRQALGGGKKCCVAARCGATDAVRR